MPRGGAESEETQVLTSGSWRAVLGAPPADAPPPPPASRAWRWLLGLALVLGLARFVHLGTWSLWVDEAHTLHDALALSSEAPQSYPLGYLLIRWVIGLYGGAASEGVLRLAPAVLGWLAIPLCFWALRTVAGRERAAAAALLLALSPWHLFWSQSARAYTLALVLSLWGGGLVLRGLFAPRSAHLASGLLVTLAAAFAHPSAALLLPVWILVPPLLRPLRASPRVRARTGVLVAIGVACGVVLAGWAAGVWSAYAEAKARGQSPAQILRSVEHFVLTTGYYATPLVCLSALWGALRALAVRAAADLIALGACVLVLGAAVAAATQVLVSAQYVYVLLPWIALLATAPLASPALAPRGLRLAWLALLAAPLLAESVLYLTVRHGDRPRWREAYAYVWERRGPYDLVQGMAKSVGEYYLEPGERDLRSVEALVPLVHYYDDVPAQWARTGRRVWLVVNHEDLQGWSRPRREAFLEFLAQECRRLRDFRIPLTPRDLDVSVYVKEW